MPYFDSNLSLGAQPPAAIAEYLAELGDYDAAQAFRTLAARGQGVSLPGVNYPWKATGVRIGYVVPGNGDRLVEVKPASSVDPDRGVIGQRIQVALDGLFVQEFPGLGVHKVLCEFAGKNQAQGTQEEVRFSLTTEARDGTTSAVRGAPIFVNLEVGQNGVSFEGRIINVQSSTDEWLLKALNSEAFKNGLSLLNSTQPVLRPFTTLTADAVEAVLERKKNKQVFNFNLGLDFSNNASAIRLCFGSYVIVQTDDTAWSWADIRLDRETNIAVTSEREPLPFNHLIVGISPIGSSVS